MIKKTKIPQVWCDTGFDVFKSHDKAMALSDMVAAMSTLLPALNDINNIQERVSEHINKNVFMALHHYSDDMTFFAEDFGPSCGGRIVVGPASDNGEFLTHYNLGTQIVDDLAAPMTADYEARESWIRFFEKSAQRLRKANERDYPVGSEYRPNAANDKAMVKK